MRNLMIFLLVTLMSISNAYARQIQIEFDLYMIISGDAQIQNVQLVDLKNGKALGDMDTKGFALTTVERGKGYAFVGNMPYLVKDFKYGKPVRLKFSLFVNGYRIMDDPENAKYPLTNVIKVNVDFSKQ